MASDENGERNPGNVAAAETRSETIDLTAPRVQELDITKAAKSEELNVQEIAQYSSAWAEIVRPITQSLLALLAAVMLLPFALIAWFVDNQASTDPVLHVLDWGKTILPPLIGFGGAITGYYFGTRAGGGDSPPPAGE